MKDFITYNIESILNQSEIYNTANKTLSDFTWRGGDSDSQGKYVSGRNPNDVHIKIWLGEDPVEMSVSYSLAWLEENRENRENKKNILLNLVEQKFIPLIGSIMEKRESH